MRTIASAILIVICLFVHTMHAQAEVAKWTTVKKSYTAALHAKGTHSQSEALRSTGSFAIDLLYYPYHYIISEPDGSRCPFSPSCSAFFIQTAKRSPWYLSVLLTADRLTRDANFLNRNRLYKTDQVTGRLLDSPERYINAFHNER